MPTSQATTLDVTTLTPMPCTACEGSGRVESVADSFTGWNGVVEPIYRADDCGHCDGEGEEPCAWCSESAAVTTVEGDAVCAGCAEEDV